MAIPPFPYAHHTTRRGNIQAFNTKMLSFYNTKEVIHWMLDSTFSEDNSLIHTGHAPENISIIRKMAMAMLKKAGKAGVSIRRK